MPPPKDTFNSAQIANAVTEIVQALGKGHKALIESSQTDIGSLAIKTAKLEITSEFVTTVDGANIGIGIAPPKIPIIIPNSIIPIFPSSSQGSNNGNPFGLNLSNTLTHTSDTDKVVLTLDIVAIGYKAEQQQDNKDNNKQNDDVKIVDSLIVFKADEQLMWADSNIPQNEKNSLLGLFDWINQFKLISTIKPGKAFVRSELLSTFNQLRQELYKKINTSNSLSKDREKIDAWLDLIKDHIADMEFSEALKISKSLNKVFLDILISKPNKPK